MYPTVAYVAYSIDDETLSSVDWGVLVAYRLILNSKPVLGAVWPVDRSVVGTCAGSGIDGAVSNNCPDSSLDT